MRVLVVEDDVQLARRIASALTEAGHDAVAVHDGKEALDKATVTPFDLIVCDDDGMVIEVLREDYTVVATYTCLPGAWGTQSFHPFTFEYQGDGSGPARGRR